MQLSSLTHILVLALALAQYTLMKFSALAERLTSLIALKALLSAVLLSTRMQEYDVKVWRNNKLYCSGMMLQASKNQIQDLYDQLVNV